MTSVLMVKLEIETHKIFHKPFVRFVYYFYL